MIVETGRIVRRAGELAWVEARSRRDCPRCAEGRGCGGGLIGRWLGNRLHQVMARNPQAHPEGSWVQLALPERSLLLAAITVYLPPLLGLLLFSGLASVALALAEPLVVLSGLAGLVAGLLLSMWIARAGGGARLFTPRIVRRLEAPPPGCHQRDELPA